MLRVILLAVIAAFAFAVPAGALENENLLVTMPKGYKVRLPQQDRPGADVGNGAGKRDGGELD
jgi:hypothetical protein